MTERDELIDCVSDLYKDITGYRPRFIFDMTTEDLSAFRELLVDELARQLEVESQQDQQG